MPGENVDRSTSGHDVNSMWELNYLEDAVGDLLQVIIEQLDVFLYAYETLEDGPTKEIAREAKYKALWALVKWDNDFLDRIGLDTLTYSEFKNRFSLEKLRVWVDYVIDGFGMRNELLVERRKRRAANTLKQIEMGGADEQV